MITKLIAGAAVVSAIALAPPAQAYPDVGCESIRWGFLGSQVRTICDGPQQPDGGWMRARVVWTPAHYVPLRCYSSAYSGSCTGDYYVDESVQAKETYLVFPYNVLQGEPGWLPPGTDVIR